MPLTLDAILMSTVSYASVIDVGYSARQLGVSLDVDSEGESASHLPGRREDRARHAFQAASAWTSNRV